METRALGPHRRSGPQKGKKWPLPGILPLKNFWFKKFGSSERVYLFQYLFAQLPLEFGIDNLEFCSAAITTISSGT